VTRHDFDETPGPRVLRQLLIGGASLLAAGVTAALVAVPALANTGSHPTPSPCGTGTTVPTASCVPSISGTNQVWLPGIGTIQLTLATSNGKTTITNATFTAASGNTTITCTPKIDKDSNRVTVLCPNSSTGQKYLVTVKTTKSGTVTAKLKVRHKFTDNDNDNDQGAGTHTFSDWGGNAGNWTQRH